MIHAVKLIPHLLAWGALLLILLRCFAGRRGIVLTTGLAGFAIGVLGTVGLRSLSATLAFATLRSVLGVGLLLLWGIAVAAIYTSTGQRRQARGHSGFFVSRICTGAITTGAALVAGAVCGCRLPLSEGGGQLFALLILIAAAAGTMACAAVLLEKRLPAACIVSPLGMTAVVLSLLLFSSSSMQQVDLFSPLSMKVMKGIHDFVHQFMESILTPDHLFIRPVISKYIGLLFGKEVGFWGGIIIWFTPAVLICVAIYAQRLPSVAHIRQGAQRRRQIAAAIRERHLRLAMPLFSVVVLAAAAYQSTYPSVEYWDPKPITITANPAGEIVIPKKGDINLGDGKLHKYLLKQGGREARFFVVMTPTGQLTVDLDACSICKPEGYGQTEGSVICYYCKTLIPLETVGRPGGCNPVPVQFAEKDDSVVINAITLINTWSTTVQSTTQGKGGGK